MDQPGASSPTERDSLPPMTHRSVARPFRINPLSGPDKLRIYLMSSKTIRVSQGQDETVVGELRTFRGYGLTRLISSSWMLLACWVLGYLAAELGSREVQWCIYAIGVLAALTFGAVVVLDYLQSLRMPTTIISVHSDGTISLYDGRRVVSDYQTLSLRTHWSHSTTTGSRTCSLDLVSIENGREHVYQLAATLGQGLGPIGRRFSTLTGIPLED